MSLLLDVLKKAAEQKADEEDMTITKTVSNCDETRTVIANPVAFDEDHTADTELKILPQENQSTESLKRVDMPSDNGSESDTTTNSSVALGRLTNDQTVTRQNSTSTHSHALDNDDRILIKAGQDDASKLFADMKSESDVGMTPDYAKKVFTSHSSIQRRNNLKIYSGVSAAILLVIFIFGLFAYKQESINIDNSLKSLKRDPLPNLPQRSAATQPVSLFAQTDNTEVDTKTRAILESAGDAPEIESKITDVITNDAEVNGIIKSDKTVTQVVEDSSIDTIDEAKNNQITKVAKPIAQRTDGDVETPSKSIQIASQPTITDQDRLLKEAYAAYQRGDNHAALQKYSQVLADDSDHRNALLARAAINVENDNRTAAIQDYQTLLIANPKDSLAMTSLISVANISPTKSESQLKGMIRDEPSSPHLNFALANVYGTQNRWQEAQTLYFTALENNPTDPNYAYNLAVSLEHIAKPRVAVTYYQRALANFNNGLALFSRAVVDQRVEAILQQR